MVDTDLFVRNRPHVSQSPLVSHSERETRKIRLPYDTVGNLLSTSELFQSFFPHPPLSCPLSPHSTSLSLSSSLKGDNLSSNFSMVLDDEFSMVDATVVVSTKFSPSLGKDVLDGNCVVTGTITGYILIEFTVNAYFENGQLTGDYIINYRSNSSGIETIDEFDHMFYQNNIPIIHIWSAVHLKSIYLEFDGYHKKVSYSGYYIFDKFPVFGTTNCNWGDKVTTFISLVALGELK